MQEEHEQYVRLPRLRAQLVEARAAGRDEEAGRLERTITDLSAVARRDAAAAVRERDETKERLLLLVERIRELQGSVSEVPGGREGRQARIREYTARARREKSRYEALNAKVRRFRWYLSGTERSGQRPGDRETRSGANRPATPLRGEPVPEELLDAAQSAKPRKRWPLILALIAAVLLVVAAALLITSV